MDYKPIITLFFQINLIFNSVETLSTNNLNNKNYTFRVEDQNYTLLENYCETVGQYCIIKVSKNQSGFQNFTRDLFSSDLYYYNQTFLSGITENELLFIYWSNTEVPLELKLQQASSVNFTLINNTFGFYSDFKNDIINPDSDSIFFLINGTLFKINYNCNPKNIRIDSRAIDSNLIMMGSLGNTNSNSVASTPSSNISNSNNTLGQIMAFFGQYTGQITSIGITASLVMGMLGSFKNSIMNGIGKITKVITVFKVDGIVKGMEYIIKNGLSDLKDLGNDKAVKESENKSVDKSENKSENDSKSEPKNPDSKTDPPEKASSSGFSKLASGLGLSKLTSGISGKVGSMIPIPGVSELGSKLTSGLDKVMDKTQNLLPTDLSSISETINKDIIKKPEFLDPSQMGEKMKNVALDPKINILKKDNLVDEINQGLIINKIINPTVKNKSENINKKVRFDPKDSKDLLPEIIEESIIEIEEIPSVSLRIKKEPELNPTKDSCEFINELKTEKSLSEDQNPLTKEEIEMIKNVHRILIRNKLLEKKSSMNSDTLSLEKLFEET